VASKQTLEIFGLADNRRSSAHICRQGMPPPKQMACIVRAIKFVDEIEIEVVGGRIIVKFCLG
jgi:hypothetical protein